MPTSRLATHRHARWRQWLCGHALGTTPKIVSKSRHRARCRCLPTRLSIGFKAVLPAANHLQQSHEGLGSVSVCPSDLQAELRPFKQVPAAYLTAVDELERAEDRYDRLSSNLYFSNNISREQYLYYRQQLRFLRMDILDARTEVQVRANDVRRLKQQYQLY